MMWWGGAIFAPENTFIYVQNIYEVYKRKDAFMSGKINLNSVLQSGQVGKTQSSQRRGGDLLSQIKLKPMKTTTTKTIKQNKDGTFSEVTITKDGSGIYEQETICEYTPDGEKVIKSVRRKDSPLYGIPTETEYIDTDGDGFADCEIQRSLNKEIKTKYPNINDEQDACNRENRRMGNIDNGIVCG